MRDQDLYDHVAAELAANSVDSGIWARALADAEGDESRARGLYIKLRVKELWEQRQQEPQRLREERRKLSDPEIQRRRRLGYDN